MERIERNLQKKFLEQFLQNGQRSVYVRAGERSILIACHRMFIVFCYSLPIPSCENSPMQISYVSPQLKANLKQSYELHIYYFNFQTFEIVTGCGPSCDIFLKIFQFIYMSIYIYLYNVITFILNFQSYMSVSCN